MCFFLKILLFFWTLPVLLQRWFSTCLVCVHSLTTRENRERPESEIWWCSTSEKNVNARIYIKKRKLVMLVRYCLKKNVTASVGYKENDALKNKTVQCRTSSTKVLHIALGLAFKTIFHWLYEEVGKSVMIWEGDNW